MKCRTFAQNLIYNDIAVLSTNNPFNRKPTQWDLYSTYMSIAVAYTTVTRIHKPIA